MPQTMSDSIYFGRICWNAVCWQHPTGKPKGESKSHAAKHGFGYDEWLGRTEWVSKDGFRYGFLQPYRKKNAGFIVPLVNLFTIEQQPAGIKRRRLLVGRLVNCEKLTDQQAQFAFSEFERRGWLRTMQSELSKVGLNAKVTTIPIDILNVRFRPGDLHWFSKPRVAKTISRVYASDRYQLFT
jgi:hypothetical protein